MDTNTTSLNTPYLFLTGVVLIAVVSLFTILRPMMDNANSIQQEISADTQTLNTKQDFLRSLDGKIAQLASLADVERQMAVVLPESDRTQDVLRVLHEYAAQSGIVITSIANNSSESSAVANAAAARGDEGGVPTGVRTLEFKVDTTGSYEQVRLFIGLVERSPRIIDVKDVSFGQGGDQIGIVTANISMQLYSQQGSQEPGI